MENAGNITKIEYSTYLPLAGHPMPICVERPNAGVLAVLDSAEVCPVLAYQTHLYSLITQEMVVSRPIAFDAIDCNKEV